MRLRVRRVYDLPEPGDGRRVLVDRLWPRGLSREAARIDLWAREVAPSSELRRWYAHEPSRWEAFKTRYFAELRQSPEAVDQLLAVPDDATVTLLHASREAERSNAMALREYLESCERVPPQA